MPRSSGTSRPRIPWRTRYQTPRSRREGRGDVDGDGAGVPPAALVDRRQPGPAGPGQEPALAPAVAPADDLEPAVAPDRQPRPAVAVEELDLPLAAAIVDAAIQAVPPDQIRGQFAPCQGDPDAHGRRRRTGCLRTPGRQKQVLPADVADVVTVGAVA